jgi:hypothetical protein
MIGFTLQLGVVPSSCWAVDEESVGQSKAKCVCACLQELNDAVISKFIDESPEILIETKPSFFAQFTLVIATQVSILLDITCF